MKSMNKSLNFCLSELLHLDRVPSKVEINAIGYDY